MDKQEVINEIEKIDYQNLKYDSPERMLSAQKQLIIDTIKRLDKPQKVKVPAFVAEYIEAHRKWGPEIFIGDWLADNDAVYKWLYNNSEKENNRRFLIAVKAFVEGYEVEDEQLYQVIINGDYLIKLFDNRNDHKFVGKEDLVIWLPSGYQLTEAEIKAIDERYWPFAVPAEKVEV